MKKFRLKLQTKITLLTIIVLTVSLASVTFLISKWAVRNVQMEVERNVMNIAKIVANAPSIRAALSKKDPEGIIQNYVMTILKSTKQIEIIVVADMKGIRYAHPNPQRIGQRFVGGDEARVLEKGDSYISEATGTLGRSIRAFAPIYDFENRQIGFAMAGNLTQSIEQTKQNTVATVVLSSFIGLFIGVMGAFILAQNIKRSLLGLEPYEIVKLYTEKRGMLDAIHEGIIAIDENEKITLVNDSAIEILQIKEKNVIGKHVMEVFPTSRLPDILKTGVAAYDKEQVINDTIIVTNRVPIKDGEKIVGAIATFRDKTMVTKLAEEMTGVRQIVEALRANSHEFMNKLHAILGLIQLGEIDEAKKYILDVHERQQQIVSLVMNRMKDPTIAGLILGKCSRAKELGIHMHIKEDSYLEKRSGKIHSHALVTIIGNLLENAMDAVASSEKELKDIEIEIRESLEQIKIVVKDSGVGIKEENLPLILNRGFTTKEGSRGVGLALVKEVVDNLHGSIDVISRLGEGTKVTIILPKEGQR